MDNTDTQPDLAYCFTCYDWHRKGEGRKEHIERANVRREKRKKDLAKKKRNPDWEEDK